MKYLLFLLTIITLSVGQLLLKKGVVDNPPSGNIVSIIKTIFTPYTFLGYMTYLVSSVLGLFVLKQFPISVAFPAMSVTYIIIIIASAIFFHEPITVNKIVGVTCIMTGVFVLFR